jgi:predicted glycosyltransferase
MFQVSKKFKPDIFVGFGSIRAAHVAKLMGKPCINFEDTDHAKWEHRLYVPCADVVLTPLCFRKDFGKKQVKIDTYKELFYLHPDYFRPDNSILAQAGIAPHERFFILRFVAWDAQHDRGQTGLHNQKETVEQLEKFGKVFITSEVPLPHHLKKYQITALRKNYMIYCILQPYTSGKARRLLLKRGLVTSKKIPCPPCLGEALRRKSFVERTIFMVRV